MVGCLKVCLMAAKRFALPAAVTENCLASLARCLADDDTVGGAYGWSCRNMLIIDHSIKKVPASVRYVKQVRQQKCTHRDLHLSSDCAGVRRIAVNDWLRIPVQIYKIRFFPQQ